MKQETLKKIVELADGFEWDRIYDPAGKECIRIRLTNHIGVWCISDIIERWVHYPLILHRAVEGWPDNLYDLIYTQDYQKTDYLTPEEQAIEACLIELLEEAV